MFGVQLVMSIPFTPEQPLNRLRGSNLMATAVLPPELREPGTSAAAEAADLAPNPTVLHLVSATVEHGERM